MNINDLKISVIVPVYKTESYLRQCIDSIIAQTYKNLEIILVNDGSPDRCGDVCDEYAEKDNRIIVIHQPNGGVSSARNVGLDIASGEYLTFIDSDDWIEPDMVEMLYNNLDKYDADISCCGHYFTYINANIACDYSDKTLILSSEQAINYLLENKYIYWSSCGKLYKKNIFNNMRFPISVSYSEDAAVIIKILSAVNSIVNNNIPKYYYRQRKESLVHLNYSSKTMAVIDSAKKMLDIIKDKYPDIINLAEAGVLKANLNVLSRMIFSINCGKIPEYKLIISVLRKNYKFMIKSIAFTRNEKIKIIAVKINIKLYKLLQAVNNWKKNKNLFE